MLRSTVRKALPSPAIEFGVVAGVGFGRRLRATSRLLDRVLSERLAARRLTLSQYFILRELWQEEGLTLRELAARVGVAEPSTMTTLQLMVKRGLVARTQSKDDRRKTHVYLTARGRALQKCVTELVVAAGRLCFQGLRSSEISGAIDVFERITNNIQKNATSRE
jgi:DNA-binding MarR family transcriptional regulator